MKLIEHPILVAVPAWRSHLSQNIILVTMPLATARLMTSASKTDMEYATEFFKQEWDLPASTCHQNRQVMIHRQVKGTARVAKPCTVLTEKAATSTYVTPEQKSMEGHTLI